jgi:predicted dehydrogenase
MQKLRVGLVGAGLVGQAEHAFCLWEDDKPVIAAPDPFHADLPAAALDAGLHVLCEKPPALTVAGCNRRDIELLTSAFRRAIT